MSNGPFDAGPNDADELRDRGYSEDEIVRLTATASAGDAGQEWIDGAEQFIRTLRFTTEWVPNDHPVRAWSVDAAEAAERDGAVLAKAVRAAAGRAIDTARKASDPATANRARQWRLKLTRATKDPEYGLPSPQRWLTAADMVGRELGTWLHEADIAGEPRAALDSLLKVAAARQADLDQVAAETVGAAVAAETERRSAPGAWEAELQRRAEQAVQCGTEPEEHPTVRDGLPMYDIKGNCTYWNKRTAAGTEPVMIAAFRADIVEEINRDDGTDRTLLWKVRVVTSDGRGGEVTIAPNQLGRPQQWATEAAGVSALVMPGLAAADHLRAAVQINSRDGVVRRTVFIHTGWRHLGDHWAYLTSTGALGASGLDTSVNVELGAGLDAFAVPDVPEVPVLRRAVRASIALLNLGPDAATVTMLASTYRAPLPLSPATGVWLYGRTGSFKSAATALMQQHFGPDMNDECFPGNWESTPNALEMKAYRCANTLFVIDDRSPDHSKADEQKHAAAVDRIFRGSANHAARERMNADGSLRAPKPARAQLLTSAEDVPPLNPSLRARLLVVEVAPGTIDRVKLSAAQIQAADGVFADAMAGYVRWLAGHLDADIGFAKGLADRQAKLRDRAWADDQHARSAVNIASLALGWELWLDFAVDVGAISREEGDAYRVRVWKALVAVGADQVRWQKDSDPVRVYLRTLNSLVASHRAYIADRATGGPPANAERWGWVLNTNTGDMHPAPGADLIGWTDREDDGDIYLQPDIAYKTVRQFAELSGAPLGKSKTDIHKELDLRGLLAAKQGSRHVDKQRVCGVSQPVLHLTRHGFMDGAEK